MAYRICKTFEVESGHMLSKHPDNCKYPHGHSRTVEIVLESNTLDQNEMVCDFKSLKDAVKAYIMTFDHSMCVNTSDPNYESLKAIYGDRILDFENQDPTTEVMVKRIFDETKMSLAAYSANAEAKYPIRSEVKLISVKLWETSSSWAEYSE